MLEQSILGKIYFAWERSAVFALLQRVFHRFLGLLKESGILSVLFSEAREQRALQSSFFGSLPDRVWRWLQKLLAVFRPVLDAVENCWFTEQLRGSVLGFLASFEGLFGAFVFVMFVVPHKYWNNLYAVLGAFVLLGIYLLLCAAGRREWRSPRLLGPGALFFLLALVLSLGFTAALGDSLRILLFFLASLAFCYVAAADFREPERLRKLLAFFYAALLLISLYGIAQNVLHLVEENASYTDVDLNKGMPGRVYSTLNNPINLSEFILMFLPLSAAFAAGARKPWQRVVLVLPLVCPALALLLTYSRGGWLAIALAAVVFTYCCNKRLIPALMVLGVLALPLMPDSILNRLATIGNTADTSTQHRLDLWKGVFRIFRDHDRAITGIGLGPVTFRYVYPFYRMGRARVGAYHTQNHYFELILEMGITGLLAFLWMMLQYAGRAGRAISTADHPTRLILFACLSSFAALAFVGLVEYVWFYQRIMFAFFLFLGIFLAAAGKPDECAE